MQYNRWNDQNILEALQSNERARVNAAFRELYHDGKLRGAVWQQVRLLGGTDDDAREVFNMALAAFDRHVRENTYDPAQSRITTFVVTIARQMIRLGEYILAIKSLSVAERLVFQGTEKPLVVMLDGTGYCMIDLES